MSKQGNAISFVRWLDGYDPAERPRLGGKNASLGELLAAGLPVPLGFAVTIDANHISQATAKRQRQPSTKPYRLPLLSQARSSERR